MFVAGGWILFKWGFEQSLRARRDIPALAGDIKTALSSLGNGKLFAIIYAEWRSTSPLPLYIDHKKTRFDIYEIPSDMACGTIMPKSDLGAPLFRQFPLEDMGDFVFEPNTLNQIRGHFVVETGKLYFARVKVYRDQLRHGKKVFAWTREIIIDTRDVEHKAAIAAIAQQE